MTKYLIIIILISTWSYSRDDSEYPELRAISETLSSYLNSHVASPASYLKGNDSYNAFHNFLESVVESGIISDTKQQIEAQNQLKSFDITVDSLANVLRTKKIQVILKDSLFTYDYYPKEYSDLRKLEDWEFERGYLIEDFTTNRMVRLSATINAEFADLIKLQINLPKQRNALVLEQFDNETYEFINTINLCREKELCISGDKVYRPVFNSEKNRGCYLFSIACDGICRDFIFIEKQNNKWIFVASYPTHLVGNEE